MDAPVITLNGKQYTPEKPKVKLWREIAKAQEVFSKEGMQGTVAIEEVIQLIVKAFNNPDITAEVLEENLDLDEFLPLYKQIAGWINDLIIGKMEQLPNDSNPTT